MSDDFSEYVAARWAGLVRSAVLLGCTHAEAEDLVQSVLERCLLKWRTVQAADDRDAYVHRILVNTFLSARRRRWIGEKPTATLPEYGGADHTTADHTIAIDDTDAIMRALDRLPGDQRTAVVLRYYAHLSEQQMATVLDVAAGTVKSRLSRAVKALAQDPDLAELRGSR